MKWPSILRVDIQHNDPQVHLAAEIHMGIDMHKGDKRVKWYMLFCAVQQCRIMLE